MHRKTIRAVLCALLVAALPSAPHALTVMSSGSDDSARVIVKFRVDAPTLRAQALSPLGRSATRALALGQRQGIAVTVGAAVSMTRLLFNPSDPAAPSAGSVSVAELSAASRIVPPLKPNELIEV